MTTELIDNQERRRRVVVRHHLHADHRAGSAEQVAGRLVGLHSSDPTTVFLSARARVDGIRVSDIERELYEDFTLLRVLGMRGTLFAVPTDLVPALHHGCATKLARAQRKRLIGYLEDQDLTDDGAAWLQRVGDATVQAISERGEAVAMELREMVPDLKLTLEFGQGKKWGGKVGISTRVLFSLACEGRIVRGRPRGTWISGQYRWATMSDRLGESLPDVEPDRARRLILRRWLSSYGPGTMTDLRWWTGWTLRELRAALELLDVAEVGTEEGPALVLADDLESTAPAAPQVVLLPSLDSTMMGWKDRSWYLGEHGGPLYDRNGNAGPTVWWNGRVVGGWAQTKIGRIAYRLLEDIGSNGSSAVADEAAALEEWFGTTRVTPRFRTPLERDLAGLDG